jgi:hypothetical protein
MALPARYFYVRALFSQSVVPLIGGNAIVLEFWDTTNYLACKYLYVGLGFGASFELPERLDSIAQFIDLANAAGAPPGNWTYFTTAAPNPVEQFDGPACFLQVDPGSRGLPPSVPQSDWEQDRVFRAGRGLQRLLFSPYVEFWSNWARHGQQRITVRLDLAGSVLDGLPSAFASRGELVKCKGPFSRRDRWT